MNRWPVWLHNAYVIFDSERDGFHNLYRKQADGAGEEELVLRDSDARTVDDITPDGRLLLFHTGRDLAVLPLDGTGSLRRLFPTGPDASTSQFSPDGRWIAYASDESGRSEVYVAPFPERGGSPSAAAATRSPGGKWQISTAGGSQPRWRSDGKEIFYLSPDKRLMAAAVRSQGSAFDVDVVRSLFDTRALQTINARSAYGVSPDGQRFLVNTRVEEAASAPITLVVNWPALLKK